MRRNVMGAALAAMTLVACGDDGGGQPTDAGIDSPDAPDVPSDLRTVATLPATLNRNLDVLFVVDDSSGMSEEQANLAANFPLFVNRLQAFPGGLLDLHLGMVSTNVGSGGVNITTCSSPGRPDGDDGFLLTNGCAGINGAFLSNVRLPDGSRQTNYAGDLASVFSCMVRLGNTGCGFEQPLEAMRRALSPARNPGFLRADAKLAVVFVTDEDDCSVRNPEMFGDPFATPSSPLGPRTSFRCFEFGVACADDPNPRAFGSRHGCVPREGSPYLHAVAGYVDHLRALKPNPRDLVVAGITGTVETTGTAEVVPDESDATRPALGPSCQSPSGVAAPAIRLNTFFNRFERHTEATVCTDNFGDAYTQIAQEIGEAVGDPCIDEVLLDADPATSGLQPSCEVTEFTEDANGTRTDLGTLPSCDAGAPPCWRLAEDRQLCPASIDGTIVQIDRTTPAPLGSIVEVRCRVE